MATTTDYLTQLQKDKSTLVTNLVAKGVDATNDETFTSLVPKVADISTGGSTEPTFTGSYDRQGLKQIGWTDEEIDYYNQNGVQWNASEDEYFKLTQTELAGDDSKNTRFIPKSSTNTGFNGYWKLLAIPLLDTNNVTNMGSMFSSCYSLTTIPLLDTNKVTSMNGMFQNCYSLTTIPQLETSNVTNMGYMFQNCYPLTTLGGLENLGQAYSTTSSANNSNYKLDLSKSTKLTEQSLINVLTNLYDIKTKGCKAQQVVLGSTNLAKLTSEEGQQALASSTEKGWSIS